MKRALCILLIGLVMTLLVSFSDQEKSSIQAQVVAQTVAVLESNYEQLYHRYAKLEMLVRVGWLDEKLVNGDIRCELALSADQKRFVVLAVAGDAIWYADKRGELNSIHYSGEVAPTAQGLLDGYCDLTPMDEASFFARKAEEPKLVDAMIKARLHQVQLAVERWGVDHSSPNSDDSTYPMSMDDVVEKGYAEKGFYANPITASSLKDRNAQARPFGQWSAGDFSYVPQVMDGKCIGYMLVAYGAKPDDGWDVNDDGKNDGVIIVLTSGSAYPEWYRTTLHDYTRQ